MTARPPGEHASSEALTPFQVEVARSFFALPESVGFLLAGGAALVAHGMTTRPTRDLDLFTSAGTVVAARDAFEAFAATRGWTTHRIRDGATFCRLVVTAGEDVALVDLAVDSPPQTAPATDSAGPTFGRSWRPARPWHSLTGLRPETSPTSTRWPRLKLPELVHQEIWAWLLVHHATSGLITRAAEAADLDPDRISFTRVLRIARRTATGTAAFPPEDLARVLPDVLAEITRKINPRRRHRSYLRVVKRARTTATASNDPAIPAPATPAQPPSISTL